MFNKPIEQMDFGELRSAVQVLYDAFAIQQRKYEDLLNNLGRENFSGIFTKEIDGMKTSISATEEGIKTAVEKATEVDDILKTSYSTTEQTADLIATKVSEEMEGVMEGYSTIEQTSKEIRTVVSKRFDIGSAITLKYYPSYDEDIYYDEYDNEVYQDEWDTEELYCVKEYDEDEDYVGADCYQYNNASQEWEKVSGNPILTVFKQTAKGFKLKGDVEINGDAIIDGTLSADKLNGSVAVLSDKVILGDPNVDNTTYETSITFGGRDGGLAQIWYNPQYDTLHISAMNISFDAATIDGI